MCIRTLEDFIDYMRTYLVSSFVDVDYNGIYILMSKTKVNVQAWEVHCFILLSSHCIEGAIIKEYIMEDIKIYIYCYFYFYTNNWVASIRSDKMFCLLNVATKRGNHSLNQI